jgi:hypothetical protein
MIWIKFFSYFILALIAVTYYEVNGQITTKKILTTTSTQKYTTTKTTTKKITNSNTDNFETIS